jgi:CRISPR/Cas system-associated exonuclease Cas4 (RecB family)
VMTAHSSKGLEFPIVFIPYLAEGEFPSNPPRSHTVPTIDWLFWGGSVDPKEEEYHLCYVAMSRAKDRLFLLRSSTYDGEIKQRSSLLPTDPPWRQRTLTSELDIQKGMSLEERLVPMRGPLPPIPVHELEQYLTCPRRYLYRHVYGLQGRSHINSKIYRCIRHTIDQVIEYIKVQGVTPNDAEITMMIDIVWGKAGLGNAPYPADQRAMIQGRVQASVQRITDPTITVESFAHQAVVELDEGGVIIHIDQIEKRQNGPVFLLNFPGEYKKEHRTEARTILAAHLYQQRYDAAPCVELHYANQQDPIPVNHRKDTVSSHIAKLNTTLHGIKMRSFPVQPEDKSHTCKTCPFNLICAV